MPHVGKKGVSSSLTRRGLVAAQRYAAYNARFSWQQSPAGILSICRSYLCSLAGGKVSLISALGHTFDSMQLQALLSDCKLL